LDDLVCGSFTACCLPDEGNPIREPQRSPKTGH
jgi:hypothetical protein